MLIYLITLLVWSQFRQRDFNWLKIHCSNCFQVKDENVNFIIIGDLIVAGLTSFTKIWKNLLGNRIIILSLSGIVSKMFFGALKIYRFSCRYKMLLYSVVQITLIKVLLMILFKCEYIA